MSKEYPVWSKPKGVTIVNNVKPQRSPISSIMGIVLYLRRPTSVEANEIGTHRDYYVLVTHSDEIVGIVREGHLFDKDWNWFDD